MILEHKGYSFNNMKLHQDITYLSTSHNNYSILTKSGALYVYDKQVGHKYERQVEDCLVIYIYFKSFTGNNRRLFGFIHSPKGIIVTDQVNVDFHLRNESIELYYKLIKDTIIDMEDEYIEFIVRNLKETYENAEIEKKPTINIKCSSVATWERYKKAHKIIKGKPLSKKNIYLNPDAIITKDNKRTIVEVEKSFHNEKDFLWKLFKIKGLEVKCHKVLFIFLRENFDYHTEIIALFEQKFGKFQRLYYTTVEDLVFKENEPMKHI